MATADVSEQANYALPSTSLVERLVAALRERRAARSAPLARQRLIVVGNGMVGQRFCERLVELGGARHFEVVVFSEESCPAYDRVHLGDVLHGKAPGDLLFRPAAWYAEHGIRLRLSDAIAGVDTQRRTVRTRRGEELGYDRLVLATGSRAVLPPVPTQGDVELVAYRTLDDVERVLHSVRTSAHERRPVAVIGGGLLGIEAARSFQRLGAQVVVFEASSQLLPRQLDAEAAEELRQQLERAGLELSLRRRIALVSKEPQALRIVFDDGGHYDVGAVVVAVGARAADDLAKVAGLRCHARGGVEVDARMATSSPSVYAIGECASNAAVPHGLVAPGYVMAELLARNLLGGHAKLTQQRVITRLKLDLTEVTVLGDPVRAERDFEVCFKGSGSYRRVLCKRGRAVAAVAIGAWDELPALQDLLARGGKLEPRALARFGQSGSLGLTQGRGGALPDAAIVCQCVGVSCGTLRRAVSQGHGSVEALSQVTGAGTLCGGCRPVLAQLVGSPRAEVSRERLLPAAALLVLGAVVATLTAPRIPIAVSVLREGFDVLFTRALLKQATGFGIVIVVALGLAFSLRKRVAWFRLSTYRALRAWHGALGSLSLLGLFLHTGFRLGSNLDRWLMLLFLGSSLSGALAALFASATNPRVRDAAVWLRRGHEVSFWPLPVLALFHALKTYYF